MGSRILLDLRAESKSNETTAVLNVTSVEFATPSTDADTAPTTVHDPVEDLRGESEVP